MSDLAFTKGDDVTFDGGDDFEYGVIAFVLYEKQELIVNKSQFESVSIPMTSVRIVNGNIVKIF